MLCGTVGEALCPACARQLRPPPTTTVRGVGPVAALFAYDGVGARVVQVLKYRDGRRLVGTLADGLTGLVVPAPDTHVTWIPTSAARRRTRGFDQSELIARALARRLDSRCRPTMIRSRGPAQTGQSRAQRATNVVLRARRDAGHACGGLIVVDDVCTTGATVRAAADALGQVVDVAPTFLVVARTP